MHEIDIYLQKYLTDAYQGKATISDVIIEEAKQAVGDSLARQFNREKRSDFRLYMSNIGRPSCQLWHEKNGSPREAGEWYFTMKMAIGDMIEAAFIAVLRAAGLPIAAVNERVTLQIDGDDLNGITDLRFEGSAMSDGVWDVKSASSWQFRNKWQRGFEYLVEHDDFGYVPQGYAYERASGYPFRGWLVVNKETGEPLVVPAPASKEFGDRAIAAATETYRFLKEDRPFVRNFSDEAEVYYKKETGNRVLCTTCSFCPYKWSCWPTLQLLPHIPSKSQNPDLKYYTYVAEKEQDNETSISNPGA